jgi:ABC-type bacteriocin/lantibiotic exporter with double-glycine peptidase domain
MKDTDKIKFDKLGKWRYGVISIIAAIFLGFIVGWLFLIPIAVIGLLIYGLFIYMKERKHRISIAIKPTEAMRAIARKEAELKIEKEKVIFDRLHGKV